MNKLTIKQRKFVNEYVKTNGNGTQAALKTYDTNDLNTAHAIASENLQKPTVKEQLDKILQRSEMNINRFTNKMSDILATEPPKGYSGADIVEVIKTGLKLHGVLTDRKQVLSYNIDANLSNMSKYELIQLHNKRVKETQDIINGELIPDPVHTPNGNEKK